MRRTAAVVVASLAVLGAACSDADGTGGAGGSSEEGGGGDDGRADVAGEQQAVGGPGEVVQVLARDYDFEGVPPRLVAGTRLSLVTDEGGEPHELVAVRLPDDEVRSASELAGLTIDELQPFLEDVAAVVVSLPGQADVPGAVVGDGTLSEPGRYLVLCTLPVGTTVAAVQAGPAPAQPGELTHFAQGMYDETTVE